MFPDGLYISGPETTLTPAFCKTVLALIDQQSWRTDIKRRTQHYGARYDYTTRHLIRDVPPIDQCYGIVGIQRAITPIFHLLCDKYGISKVDGKYPEFDQIIVNEYLSNENITAHTDAKHFGPIIMTVTFGDPAEFIMKHGAETCSIMPWNGCIVALCGDARTSWTHETKKVTNPAFRRVSVTFRTII
jgi:hypothetical protein